jgi:hypothetical protein
MQGPLVRFAAALVLAAGFTSLAHAQRDGGRTPPPGGDIKVQVSELQIQKKIPKELRFDDFDMYATTRMRVLFMIPDKVLLGLDVGACKLTSFKDDKGTDLTKADGFFTPKWVDYFDMRVSKDGKNCLVNMYFPGVPVTGATKVILKATLVVLEGKDEKSEEKKDMTLTEAGTEVGQFVVAAPKFIKPFGNRTPVEILSPSNNIKEVKFFDGNGNALMTHFISRNPTFDAKPRYRVEYDVENLPKNFTVRIAYFGRTEQVQVPVDLETGIGIGP